MTAPQSTGANAIRRTRRWCLALFAALFGLTGSTGPVLADKLRLQLESLAAERGFRVDGLERIGDEESPGQGSGKVADQINILLANYNFILTHDSSNKIAQLTIVGLRVPPPPVVPPPENIKLESLQAEHYVEAVLTGPNGRLLPLKFMVDTGASTLVLPQSLAQSLGYGAEELRTVHVQTANGRTMGKTGTLQSVRVGEAESASVAVTFVEDDLLGGKRLLGMSFLGRFRMTIDGSSGVLQLEKHVEQ